MGQLRGNSGAETTAEDVRQCRNVVDTAVTTEVEGDPGRSEPAIELDVHGVERDWVDAGEKAIWKTDASEVCAVVRPSARRELELGTPHAERGQVRAHGPGGCVKHVPAGRQQLHHCLVGL